ncbi:MAG TPA: efflux RND transporter permease subunit [Gemmataceae bacterium]|nr:efflux RND transporter permease subunit [Gemmataceae bacterium]
MLTYLCLIAITGCGLQNADAPAKVPVIIVSASYPGANASDVADTIAAPLEQQINGVEGAVRIESESTNDGSYVARIYFSSKTDLKRAVKLVENRAALADPLLPEIVRLNKVTVKARMEPARAGTAIALIDHGYHGWDALRDRGAAIAKRLEKEGKAKGLKIFPSDEKQVYVLIDRNKCAERGIEMTEVKKLLAAGQLKSVADYKALKIKGKTPLTEVAEVKEVTGPSAVYRVNLDSAIRITAPDGVPNAKKLAEPELKDRKGFKLLDLSTP